MCVSKFRVVLKNKLNHKIIVVVKDLEEAIFMKQVLENQHLFFKNKAVSNLQKIMEENKLITSHWITAHESGIITLIINTVDRCVGFHRCNDNWYIVEDEDGNVEHLRIELPLQEEMRCLHPVRIKTK